MTFDPSYPKPLSDKQVQARRQRSIAIAIALAVMVLLFYAATIVRMGGNVVNRPISVVGFSFLGMLQQ